MTDANAIRRTSEVLNSLEVRAMMELPRPRKARKNVR